MDEWQSMIIGVTIAVGVGSPEGKLVANVGSVYIDKNATGGAVRCKTSGVATSDAGCSNRVSAIA